MLSLSFYFVIGFLLSMYLYNTVFIDVRNLFAVRNKAQQISTRVN